jgi:hypothetical protein
MGHILMIGRKLHGKIVERVVTHVSESGELFLSEKRKRKREREREREGVSKGCYCTAGDLGTTEKSECQL